MKWIKLSPGAILIAVATAAILVAILALGWF